VGLEQICFVSGNTRVEHLPTIGLNFDISSPRNRLAHAMPGSFMLRYLLEHQQRSELLPEME
jgi:hypothetical protein